MDERTGKSKYNMSGLIMQHLFQMMVRAANYYRSGQIDKWFHEWKNIKFQIVAELKDEERESLEEKEKGIAEPLDNSDFKTATPLIEEYLTEIQDYIKEKDIGLVEKGDETVFT